MSMAQAKSAELHRQVEESGYLDWPVHPEAWPDWVREHVAGCPECQRLLRAARLLDAAQHLLGAEPPPPPPLALLKQPPRSAPPSLSLLARDLSPFPSGAYRATAGGPLVLATTSRGLRGHHPEARSLAVFAVAAGSSPVVLKSISHQRPGIGFDIAYEPEEACEVVAVATREPSDPEVWRLWLEDLARRGDIRRALEEAPPSERVHVRRLSLAPGLGQVELRVTPSPLPEATPEVAELLTEAARVGRQDDMERAAILYQRAARRARELEDTAGLLKASGGLSMALNGLGYSQDADEILAPLARELTLDPQWAEWLCRFQAQRALQRFDTRQALRWATHARRVNPFPTPWLHALDLQLAWIRGRPTETAVVLEQPSPSDGDERAELLIRPFSAALLAALGRPAEGRALLADWNPSRFGSFEQHLLRTLAEMALRHAEGRTPEWRHQVEALRVEAQKRPGEFQSTSDAFYLVLLASMALDQGHSLEAASLLRLRFGLDDDGPPALMVAADPKGVLVLGPEHGIRRLSLSRGEFLRLALRAREGLVEGSVEEARVLAALLFPEGRIPSEQLRVYSDGLLAGIPMLGLALAAWGERPGTPVLREVAQVHRRQPVPRSPTSSRVVSIADAQGDLPRASSEIRRDEADLWLRGQDATRAALEEMGPVGLLHLAVHTRREDGIPELVLADGPLTPFEISRLKLQGNPVVLLSACETGAAPRDTGIERSFAAAFLRAGASSVIATHWPVRDEEMFLLVRELRARWPFEDPAETVARIARLFREKRYPPRLWAVLAVY